MRTTACFLQTILNKQRLYSIYMNSQNNSIILLSMRRCCSRCTMMSHFIKYNEIIIHHWCMFFIDYGVCIFYRSFTHTHRIIRLQDDNCWIRVFHCSMHFETLLNVNVLRGEKNFRKYFLFTLLKRIKTSACYLRYLYYLSAIFETICSHFNSCKIYLDLHVFFMCN